MGPETAKAWNPPTNPARQASIVQLCRFSSSNAMAEAAVVYSDTWDGWTTPTNGTVVDPTTVTVRTGRMSRKGRRPGVQDMGRQGKPMDLHGHVQTPCTFQIRSKCHKRGNMEREKWLLPCCRMDTAIS